MIIPDPARNRCMLLELKHVNNERDMEKALKEAESQIIKNRYESRFVYQGYGTILKYGMVFWGKRVIIEGV